MKKLLIPLLALVGLTAYPMGRRPPAPQPASAPLYTIEEYDSKDGKLLSRRYDAAGQSGASAAGATVADSGAKKVAEMLASRWDGVTPAGYISTRRAAIDQPDVALEQSLQNDHKAAVAAYQAAAANGASGSVLTAAMKTVDSISNQIADVRKAKAQAPKPDSSVLDFDALIIGADAPATIAMLGDNGVRALAATAGRSTFTNEKTERQTDTTNTNDWQGAGSILETVARMKEVDLKIAELNKAISDARPAPVVKPVEPKPAEPEEVDDDTPGDAPVSSAEYDKLPKKNFIYKTRLEKHNPVTRHDAAILIPKDRPAPVSIDGIGHEIVENYLSKSEDRWLLRTKGPLTGTAATLTVTYKDGSKEQFKIKALNSRTEYAPGAYKKTTPPADAPTTSSLFILEADKLTLRPDFAAAVRTIDVLTKINDPKVKGATNSVPSSVRVDAGPLGPYTWGIPKPLGSYPRGNMPNTWRIGLIPGKIPADVTYHTSIMQTFIQDGATKTFPPTTRE